MSSFVVMMHQGNSQGLHSCIMTTKGHSVLKHYAALKGLPEH